MSLLHDVTPFTEFQVKPETYHSGLHPLDDPVTEIDGYGIKKNRAETSWLHMVILNPEKAEDRAQREAS